MKKRIYFIVSIFLMGLTLSGCLKNPVPVKEDYELNDATYVYDGEPHSLTLEGVLPHGYKVVYTGNDQVMVGNYVVIATIIDEKTDEELFQLQGELSILSPITDVKFESKNYIYDGSTFEISVSNLDESKYYVVYDNNTGSVVGKYYATAEVYDNDTQKLFQTMRAIMTIDNPENEDFEQFMDEFLVSIFEGDQMSVNFFFNNPENYGIEHYDAMLSIYDNSISYEESMQQITDLLKRLYTFSDSKLSFEEQTTFKIVSDYLNYLLSISEDMSYMTNSYLGSYLGLQANLPISLAEYKFRCEQDIKDFIAYLDSAPLAFASYVEFTKEQITHGYAMPDFVIDKVASQCEEFIAMGNDNFLIDIFNSKIDNIDFGLEDATTVEYKEMAKTSILGSLTEAYQYVLDELPTLKGNANVYGGLAMYEEGATYYINELKNVLGLSDINGDDLFSYLYGKYDYYSEELMNIVNSYQGLSSNDLNDFLNGALFGANYSDYSYDELISVFREYAKEIVPEIEEMPEVSIKYVPEALENNFSPAAYFVSPLDETHKESVYINPQYGDDYNYIYTTLAHEGYPGHLYQNVYAKSLAINDVRKVVRCSGYMEGWATYVEHKAYYFADKYTSVGYKLALEYNRLSNILNLTMSSIFDVAIHYYGYNISEFTELVNELTGNQFTETDLAIVETFQQIIEVPTNMSMYGVSFLILEDLHEYAKETLGEHFDEVEFNTILLNDGAAPLDIVQMRVNSYLDDKMFILYGKTN